ncbi:MAG: hypothetical protein ABFR97_07325 [Thermodesulfobacteriota bacterium]
MKKLFIPLILLFLAVNQAAAADCVAVRKKINQEKDLFQKRELAKQGLKDCPNDPVINFIYAYSMERFRKYELARKHYKIATKLDRKYAKAFFGLGDMYSHLNKPAQAISAYKRGLALKPNDKRAQNSLAEAKKAAKAAGIKVATVAPKRPKKSLKKTKKQAKQAKKAPKRPLNFQPGNNQLPVIARPMQGEKIQAINFKLARKKDNTGFKEDQKMMGGR